MDDSRPMGVSCCAGVSCSMGDSRSMGRTPSNGAHNEHRTAQERAEETRRQAESGPATCRICLDEGGAVIAPCRCKGTQKYVHSECLDQWRAAKEGFAFSHCTLCGMRYHLRLASPRRKQDSGAAKARRLPLRFLRPRELFVLALSAQLVLLLTRYGELTIDGNFHLKHACGTPQDSVLFRRFCGLLVFVASAAVLSLVSVTLQKGQQGMASIGVEAAVMLGVAVAVFLMHALGVVGVFYALVVALLPAHRILERHEQMSTRGALTQMYIVQSLEVEAGEDPGFLPPEHESFLRSLGLW